MNLTISDTLIEFMFLKLIVGSPKFASAPTLPYAIKDIWQEIGRMRLHISTALRIKTNKTTKKLSTVVEICLVGIYRECLIEHSADEFAQQFTNKMERIRASTAGAPAPVITKRSVSEPLSHFEPVTSENVIKVLKTAPTKQCALIQRRPGLSRSFPMSSHQSSPICAIRRLTSVHFRSTKRGPLRVHSSRSQH